MRERDREALERGERKREERERGFIVCFLGHV